MTAALPPPQPIREIPGSLDEAGLAALCDAGEPVVLRDCVAHWPVVAAARQGDRAFVDYLVSAASGVPVTVLAAHPREGGRFFYDAALSRLNFETGTGSFAAFLEDLLRAANMPDAPGLAVQSADVVELLPRLARDNRLPVLDAVRARIWIGNRIRVAPHYDAKENIACCVAGRRRFTLFPPAQIANLYPGPLELTPAGTPISLVDIDSPDLDRFPRFRVACAAAQQAELAPGDAIYIPYGWWHGVASLDAVNALVNYWWTEGLPDGIGGPYDALLAGMLALRHLPDRQRAVWQEIVTHYCFSEPGLAAGHIPEPARGILGAPSPDLFARMRALLSRR